MKKVSVYFTDPQSTALEAQATQAGITFAEALRRALDEWLAYKEGKPMTIDATPVPVVTSTVTVITIEDDERITLRFRNASVVHDEFNGHLTIYRRKKDGSLGRTLAYFSGADVSSWYEETDANEDEDE